MSGPLSRKAVLAAVKNAQQQIHAWENLSQEEAGTLMMFWAGVPVKVLNEAVKKSLYELFNLVETMDVAPDAYELVMAIDEMEEAFLAWGRMAEGDVKAAPPAPTPECWGRWKAVEDKINPTTFSHPEPVAALVRDKVNIRQIAKTYGFIDDHGSPDLDRVQREIENPGSEYDPKTATPPAKLRYEARVAERWKERPTRRGKANLARPRDCLQDARQRPAKKKPPETPDEQLRQGVNTAQIAKTHGMTVAEVRALAAELRIPVDGNLVADVLLRRENRDEEEREIERAAEDMRVAAFNSYPDLGSDYRARVTAMSADGVKPGDIKKALADPFPTLTYQQVMQIIGGNGAGKKPSKETQSKETTAAK